MTFRQPLPDTRPMEDSRLDPTARGIRCSFCLKPEGEVANVIAGPGSYICNECVDRCVEIMTAAAPEPNDDPRPRLPSWSSMTDRQVLDRLPEIAVVAAQVEGALAQWVAECRRRGTSWAKVGASLQMSRQSAWERFSDAV